ncbi:unnamed protein product [Amoebophrya sp. A25]|nr:unnamed protein product [Amoebophrya sp. A25]|eukprot:GSA25T00016574001.1
MGLGWSKSSKTSSAQKPLATEEKPLAPEEKDLNPIRKQVWEIVKDVWFKTKAWTTTDAQRAVKDAAQAARETLDMQVAKWHTEARPFISMIPERFEHLHGRKTLLLVPFSAGSPKERYDKSDVFPKITDYVQEFIKFTNKNDDLNWMRHLSLNFFFLIAESEKEEDGTTNLGTATTTKYFDIKRGFELRFGLCDKRSGGKCYSDYPSNTEQVKLEPAENHQAELDESTRQRKAQAEANLKHDKKMQEQMAHGPCVHIVDGADASGGDTIFDIHYTIAAGSFVLNDPIILGDDQSVEQYDPDKNERIRRVKVDKTGDKPTLELLAPDKAKPKPLPTRVREKPIPRAPAAHTPNDAAPAGDEFTANSSKGEASAADAGKAPNIRKDEAAAAEAGDKDEGNQPPLEAGDPLEEPLPVDGKGGSSCSSFSQSCERPASSQKAVGTDNALSPGTLRRSKEGNLRAAELTGRVYPSASPAGHHVESTLITLCALCGLAFGVLLILIFGRRQRFCGRRGSSTSSTSEEKSVMIVESTNKGEQDFASSALPGKTSGAHCSYGAADDASNL